MEIGTHWEDFKFGNNILVSFSGVRMVSFSSGRVDSFLDGRVVGLDDSQGRLC